jgi:hypothetical protein
MPETISEAVEQRAPEMKRKIRAPQGSGETSYWLTWVFLLCVPPVTALVWDLQWGFQVGVGVCVVWFFLGQATKMDPSGCLYHSPSFTVLALETYGLVYLWKQQLLRQLR